MSKKHETQNEKKKIESRYNPSLLRECIQEGLDANQILERLEIKHRQTLKQHILKLINDDKVLYEVRGLYLKSSNRPRVNKKFELKINLAKVDLKEMTLKEGDEFSVSVESEMIILTKV